MQNENTVKSKYQLELDDLRKTEKNNKYLSTIKRCCFFLGAFGGAYLTYLLFAYAFLGLFNVFGLNFSIPSIIDFVINISANSLSYAIVTLLQLLVCALFFIVYLIILIVFVVKYIKALAYLSAISELNNSNVNHKELTQKLMVAIFKISKTILIFTLFAFTASGALSVTAIIAIALFFLLYAFNWVLCNILTSYDIKKEQFNKKMFYINLIKKLALFLLTFILVLTTAKPCFVQIMNGLKNYFYSNTTQTFVSIFNYTTPAINLLVYVFALIVLRTFIVKNTLPQSDLQFDYNDENARIKKPLKSNAVTIASAFMIFVCVLYLIYNIVIGMFNAFGDFIIPNDLVYVIFYSLLNALPLILISISIMIVNNTKEYFLTKFS